MVQWNTTSVYGTEGCWFESSRGYVNAEEKLAAIRVIVADTIYTHPGEALKAIGQILQVIDGNRIGSAQK